MKAYALPKFWWLRTGIVNVISLNTTMVNTSLITVINTCTFLMKNKQLSIFDLFTLFSMHYLGLCSVNL